MNKYESGIIARKDVSGARSHSKATAEGREGRLLNIPVSWISIPQDTSARTSLRSVADYLSEKETESSFWPQRPKRNLCLSAESLQALEKAEKLVEEAERQLSQLNLKTVLAPDFESGGIVDETQTYIRKIVASSFEKGKFEPPAEDFTIPIGSRLKCNFVSFLSSGRTARAETTSERKVTTESAIDDDDDCLFCSGDRPGDAATSPDELHRDKLTVQRGPAISIKADLRVQTSKIVDIQPLSRASILPFDNVANFEFRHESFSPNDEGYVAESEKPETSMRDATTSISGLAQPIDRTYSICREPCPDSSKLDFGSSSDIDLSLGEPKIIVELDALLGQQRSIMRKVRQSSQALDELFSTRSVSPSCSYDYSAESFDSAVHDSAVAANSRRSCKSNTGHIEHLTSLSLQIPKPNDSNAIDSSEIEKIPENEHEASSLLVNSYRIEDEEKTQQEKESALCAETIANDTSAKELKLSVESSKETDGAEESANSLHKTSHLIDSLSDDQSVSEQFSNQHQSVVQSKNDAKVRTATADAVNKSDVSAKTRDAKTSDVDSSIDSSSAAVIEGMFSVREESSDGNRSPLLPSRAPLVEEEKLSLLQNLESCFIPCTNDYKRLPFTSTILNDTVKLISSANELSELSCVTTRSEGEIYASSSASYSLGEVRRKKTIHSSAASQCSSSKISSNSHSSRIHTPSIRCSSGEFVGSTMKQ